VSARLRYALAALVLFAIEVFIALFVRDAFIRPYVGDVLAVMLVYCALRAIFPIGVAEGAVAALGLAFAIETAQAFGLIGALGWRGTALRGSCSAGRSIGSMSSPTSSARL
jgi:hypothetical protein